MGANLRLVIGTRPEAIKLAPVADALAACGFAPRLILTGQHPSLDPAEFGLAHFRAERLDCPGEANPDSHAKSVAAAVAPRLSGVDLLIVQGDTSSALGGDWLALRGTDIIVSPAQSTMREAMSDLSILERAFALAKSGECSGIDDIRRKLKSERYESIDQHLAGPSIKRQLNQLCAAAKAAE